MIGNKATFSAAFERHSDVLTRSMQEILPDVERAGALLLSALEHNKTVFTCGNGGSAADSQHFASELLGHYKGARAPLKGIALTADTAALTAIANDYGFEYVFKRQVEALGQRGDVLVAFTTSGMSKNVRTAIGAARAKRMHVIVMTGQKGAALARVADSAIVVPSRETARIQEVHQVVYHAWCEYIDQRFTS